MARVLVVDDEAPIRRALSANLRALNYDVDLATTGEEALELAARHHPDVVILDLDGFDEPTGRTLARTCHHEQIHDRWLVHSSVWPRARLSELFGEWRIMHLVSNDPDGLRAAIDKIFGGDFFGPGCCFVLDCFFA